MTMVRPDLTDRQWRYRKRIIQKIANAYFDFQESDGASSGQKDDWHNMFVEIMAELHDKYEKDKWLSVYTWLKQLKGTQV